jgi:hypothetical protein
MPNQLRRLRLNKCIKLVYTRNLHLENPSSSTLVQSGDAQKAWYLSHISDYSFSLTQWVAEMLKIRVEIPLETSNFIRCSLQCENMKICWILTSSTVIFSYCSDVSWVMITSGLYDTSSWLLRSMTAVRTLVLPIVIWFLSGLEIEKIDILKIYIYKVADLGTVSKSLGANMLFSFKCFGLFRVVHAGQNSISYTEQCLCAG